MTIFLLVCFSLTTTITAIGPTSMEYPGHNFKLKAIMASKWKAYYNCLENERRAVERGKKMNGYFIFPGQSIHLSCPMCPRPFGDYSQTKWAFRAFFDDQNTSKKFDNVPEEFTVTDVGELIGLNARPEYTGIYRCTTGQNSLAFFALEIPNRVNLVQVNDSEDVPTVSLENQNLLFEIRWSPWTECSACDSVGKQYRYGTCMMILKSTIEDNNEILHKILSVFGGNLSCSSRFLFKTKARKLAEEFGANHLVAVKFCKDNCTQKNEIKQVNIKKFKNSKEIKEALKSYDPIPTIARTTIHFALNSTFSLQCPGTKNRNVPVTWRKNQQQLFPEIISKETKGRVEIDDFGRIFIRESTLNDQGLYSCWARDSLIGSVLVYTERIESESGNLTMTFLTGIVLFGLFFHIARRAFKRREMQDELSKF